MWRGIADCVISSLGAMHACLYTYKANAAIAGVIERLSGVVMVASNDAPRIRQARICFHCVVRRIRVGKLALEQGTAL